MKRFFYILFSLSAILILSPILILTILILRFSGEGEIFFLQKRVGLDGNRFNIIKFATMLKNSSEIGTRTITIKDDPRILPFGKFLRKSKINELPQLFNIVSGDMSIIGPRPLTTETFNHYSIIVRNIITKEKPGLSGLGSIVFRREEEILNKSNINTELHQQLIEYKGSLEMWYIENNNLFIYFFLILLTILVIFSPKYSSLIRILNNLPSPSKELKKVLQH